MSEAGRVNNVGITSKRLAEPASHLRHFERVREPRANKVATACTEDLGLGTETP